MLLIENIIGNNILSTVTAFSESDEFGENHFKIIFPKLSFNDYIKLNNHMTMAVNNYETYQSLNISFKLDNAEYRCTIKNFDVKTDFVSDEVSNDNLDKLNEMLNKLLNVNSDRIRIVQKINEKTIIVDHLFYDLLIKLDNLITIKHISQIGSIIRITITNHVFIKHIDDSNYNWNLVTYKNKSNITKYKLYVYHKNFKKINNLFNHIFYIIKILSHNEIPLTKIEYNFVIDKYKKMMDIQGDTLKYRIAKTLDINNVLYNISENYALTDKADGERMFLIIVFGCCYLLDLNIKLIKLNIFITNCDDTIIDGELVISNNKFLYLAFDILFCRGVNVMNLNNLIDRINNLDDVLNKINENDSNHNYNDCRDYNIDDYETAYDICNHEYINYINEINNGLHDKNLVIKRKLYMFSEKNNKSKIFMYASMIWNYYLSNKDKYNYELDGLIFTPVFDNYLLDSKLNEYKWKPPELSTIDFYISFRKNNNSIAVYHESENDYKYIIADLYVNNVKDGRHYPIKFNPGDKGNKYACIKININM